MMADWELGRVMKSSQTNVKIMKEFSPEAQLNRRLKKSQQNGERNRCVKCVGRAPQVSTYVPYYLLCFTADEIIIFTKDFSQLSSAPVLRIYLILVVLLLQTLVY